MCCIKKTTSIILSTFCFCPFITAIKPSISVPEGLYKKISESLYETDDSPYNLDKLCDHIISMAPHMPIDNIIKETSYICLLTFKKIKFMINDKNTTDSYFYIASISNYDVIVEKLNYILYGFILSKNDNIKQFFSPSKETKSNLINSIFAVASALKKYENKFFIELFATNPLQTQTRHLHDLMNETWDGLWKISQLNSFRTVP